MKKTKLISFALATALSLGGAAYAGGHKAGGAGGSGPWVGMSGAQNQAKPQSVARTQEQDEVLQRQRERERAHVKSQVQTHTQTQTQVEAGPVKSE